MPGSISILVFVLARCGRYLRAGERLLADLGEHSILSDPGAISAFLDVNLEAAPTHAKLNLVCTPTCSPSFSNCDRRTWSSAGFSGLINVNIRVLLERLRRIENGNV